VSTSFLTSERVVILVCTTNMRAYPMATCFEREFGKDTTAIIDNWRSVRRPIPSGIQAMRQLVEIAVAASAGRPASMPAQPEQTPAPPR
jgi:hypothetical protein